MGVSVPRWHISNDHADERVFIAFILIREIVSSICFRLSFCQKQYAAKGIRTPVVGVKGRHDWPLHYSSESMHRSAIQLGRERIKKLCLENPARPGRRAGSPHSPIGLPSFWVTVLKAAISCRVTGPGLPFPMTRPSISRIGPTSAAVPVTKTSSAV